MLCVKKISSFQQHDELVPEAWECFQDYIAEHPRHGMENWLLMQTFYHGLNTSTRETMDATARGAFLSLNLTDATSLVEKMAFNQSQNKEHVQPRKRGGGRRYASTQGGRHVVCQNGPTGEEA
jgi:hypothetical protein